MRASLLQTLSAVPALLGAPAVHAQNPGILVPGLPGCDFATGRLTAACAPVFIGHLISLVFGLISIFFLINVMLAGYQIAIGSWSGDKTKGKDRLQWSVIGLVVSVCAFLILNLVVSVISPSS